MRLQLGYLSDDLKSIRNMFAEFRHGGISLGSESVEALVQRLDELGTLARRLEHEISRREWNDRAAAERLGLVNDKSAAVLAAMRDVGRPQGDGVVIPFPGGGRS